MGDVRWVEPVVRICAVITRHDDARLWAIERLAERWGEIVVQSPPIDFEAGGYYTETMGCNLKKVLVATGQPLEPDNVADWKIETNRWEQEFSDLSPHSETRPLNLDPGYMTQAKLVLATTKDRDHRIYLRDGMFAEVTLTYVGKRWHDHRWTYPSYRSQEVAEFAAECRRRLRAYLKENRQFRIAE